MDSYRITAEISESVGANHGRAQYQCVRLEPKMKVNHCEQKLNYGMEDEVSWIASPIRGKSGLITTLAGADGYFCISRDCEGISQGAKIQVTVSIGD
jgi:molybdopterin molybdotransferase